jgi:hypothetical protein
LAQPGPSFVICGSRPSRPDVMLVRIRTINLMSAKGKLGICILFWQILLMVNPWGRDSVQYELKREDYTQYAAVLGADAATGHSFEAGRSDPIRQGWSTTRTRLESVFARCSPFPPGIIQTSQMSFLPLHLSLLIAIITVSTPANDNRTKAFRLGDTTA